MRVSNHIIPPPDLWRSHGRLVLRVVLPEVVHAIVPIIAREDVDLLVMRPATSLRWDIDVVGRLGLLGWLAWPSAGFAGRDHLAVSRRSASFEQLFRTGGPERGLRGRGVLLLLRLSLILSLLL